MTPARGEGVRHFRHQRLTAVMLIPLVLAFLVMCVAFVGADYLTVRSAFMTSTPAFERNSVGYGPSATRRCSRPTSCSIQWRISRAECSFRSP